MPDQSHVDVIFASAGIGALDEPLGTVSPEAFDATSPRRRRGGVAQV
jgi:hypothetical protein